MMNHVLHPSEDRQTFMARIREALGRSSTAASGEPPAVDESLVRLASANDDLVGLFADRAIKVGMKVHRVAAASGVATAQVMQILTELQARRVVVSAGGVGEAIGLNGSLQQSSAEVVDWRAGGMDCQYEADAGITDVHAALAETGTLICCSDREHSRGLSLVPHNHIALVRASDILPDMIDYWARLKGLPNTSLPASQAFITGPSKTADIEGILVTGVHGPKQVHIVLIEDL